jgi:hypothetical protein
MRHDCPRRPDMLLQLGEREQVDTPRVPYRRTRRPVLHDDSLSPAGREPIGGDDQAIERVRLSSDGDKDHCDEKKMLPA